MLNFVEFLRFCDTTKNLKKPEFLGFSDRLKRGQKNIIK